MIINIGQISSQPILKEDGFFKCLDDIAPFSLML